MNLRYDATTHHAARGGMVQGLRCLGLVVACATAEARSLYATKAPLQTGRLAVSAGHSLYYEVHGNPEGAPALFLHGGPGAGCFTRHAGFFDPAHYKVVLFDQRGCGRSTPRGELLDNDTKESVTKWCSGNQHCKNVTPHQQDECANPENIQHPRNR